MFATFGARWGSVLDTDRFTVRKVRHRDGRLSYWIFTPDGLVHRSSLDVLKRFGSSSQQTYAYSLVDHLNWLEANGKTPAAVTVDDLHRYMNGVTGQADGVYGMVWRKPTQKPIGAAAAGNVATIVKAYYLALSTSENVHPELVDALKSSVVGRRGSSRRVVEANPLAPRKPTAWLNSLGLSGITTHRTRATLATSLLNNGAPTALVRQLLGHFSQEALVHYANYSNDSLTRHLQQVWAAGPGMDKPGTILLRPHDLEPTDASAAAARIDLAIVPVEDGLCRYGPVVGGAPCPFGKNCSTGPSGPCEHFVLTGADLAYWERKRDAAYHFAEGAPSGEARDYILRQWHPWEPVLSGLREALDELGLLEEAENLDLRSPVHDYFNPLFSTGWPVAQLDPAHRQLPE